MSDERPRFSRMAPFSRYLPNRFSARQVCPHWPLTLGFDKVSLTCQDTAGDPRDSLYLCDIVVHKVLITGGVQVFRVTERLPQFGCDRFVVYFHHLSANVVPF